jgi:ring-1,2-phenylacetyl-CoA epoxidase subunit PaaE
MKFFALKIKDIRRETADCVSIVFDVPPQYLVDFAFQQGQYLTLKTEIKGEEVRRSYSICSAPCDNELRIVVKQVENGLFSTFANNELKKGDILEAMPPTGHFYTILSEKQVKTYIFFAAGSGITPVISNIKAIFKTEPLSNCSLIYGNRQVSSIIFKEDLEAFKNQNLGRFQVFNVLSRERNESDLLHGRLNKAKINLFFEKIPQLLRGDEYFACGPVEMIDAVKAILIEKKIAEKNIHFELFNAPTKKGVKNGETVKGAVGSTAVIQLDGLTFDVQIEKGQNILDAAQLMGADVPFACKGGVCCTCRAKLIEGDVEMTANYALTKEEVKQGFILTCQAVPKTERVVVNFDVK